ncbi:phage tail protein [Sphingomonas koreensis]
MTSEPCFPPPAFGFGVWLSPGTLPQLQDSMDAVFQEVSGIDPHVLSEEVVEGGVNSFVHRLPVMAKHSNLVLKRGYVTGASALARWAGQAVGSTFAAPISTSALSVSLLGPGAQPTVTWSFQNAWPVRWEIGELDTTRNELLTETLEIAYTFFTRATSS